MVEASSLADVIQAVRDELRLEPLSSVRLNHAATRIDQVGRRLHGVDWTEGHEIGGCLTVAVRELSRSRSLPEAERAETLQEVIRQLDMALALAREGLRPKWAESVTELTAQEGPVTNETEQYRRPVGVAPESVSGRLVVVCDDGSIWKWLDDGNRWEEMTPVPGSRRAGPRAGSPADR